MAYWLPVLILVSFGGDVESKSQYVMPMSMGMKMSIPYDIANIFIFPIAGAVSVSVSIALLFILFFGVITSPFGYFFGVPSRKYVMGGTPEGEVKASPRFLPDDDIFNRIQGLDLFPSSAKDFFFWMDQEDLDGDCQLLALCHAHSAIQFLPMKILRIYSIFSKTLEVPSSYRRAIIRGLGSGDSCSNSFKSCTQSDFSLTVKTLLKLLPDSVKNENFRKRKEAMYN